MYKNGKTNGTSDIDRFGIRPDDDWYWIKREYLEGYDRKASRDDVNFTGATAGLPALEVGGGRRDSSPPAPDLSYPPPPLPRIRGQLMQIRNNVQYVSWLLYTIAGSEQKIPGETRPRSCGRIVDETSSGR